MRLGSSVDALEMIDMEVPKGPGEGRRREGERHERRRLGGTGTEVGDGGILVSMWSIGDEGPARTR